MNEQASGSGFLFKALAFVALLVCAWILLKAVIGIVTTVVWTIVIVAAIVGVIWALGILRR